MGNFRIAMDTPPRDNYSLAIFQISTQEYLAFSTPFEIFPPEPPPSTTAPNDPTLTPTSQPPISPPPLPSPSTPPPTPSNTQVPSTRTGRTPTQTLSATASRPATTFVTTRSPPALPSSSPSATTQTSNVASPPAPTSPGRPPLDAGQGTEPKSAEPQVDVSAIVGGTVGTVVAAGIVFWIFMCWRKHKRRSKGIPRPFPFLIVPPLRVLPPPSPSGLEPSPMRENSLYTIQESVTGSRFDDVDRQAEFLIRERQRIDAKLAELERSRQGTRSKRSALSATASSSSGSASASASPSSSSASTLTPFDLLQELNAMREKVRQLEAARDAHPPSFDDNSTSQLLSATHDPPTPGPSNTKAALRSNSHSLFSPPPEYDTTSPLHHSSHHSPRSKTQCFCRDCG
ncbi:hypothetical protein BJ165DRAFT_1510714 [Panaeolus papilionaceus]|nr:hypothetical protein BJ165DRAFT_1510714 [Panaeolus papilionaceus]